MKNGYRYAIWGCIANLPICLRTPVTVRLKLTRAVTLRDQRPMTQRPITTYHFLFLAFILGMFYGHCCQSCAQIQSICMAGLFDFTV